MLDRLDAWSAIPQLEEKVENIEERMHHSVDWITGGNEADATAAATDNTTITATAEIPDGYFVVGVARITSNHSSALQMTGFDLDADGTVRVTYYNRTSTTYTNVKVTTQVICMKREL